MKPQIHAIQDNQVTKNNILEMSSYGSLRVTCVSLGLLLALSSCASVDTTDETAAIVDEASTTQEQSAKTDSAGDADADALASTAAELAATAVTESQLTEPVFYKGNDSQIRSPETREAIRLIGEDVSLNFEQAPLAEVVHAVMGDILGLDYIVDGPIDGEITLRTRTPLPRGELLEVLESLLKANNILMIRRDDDRFLITSSQFASRLSPSVTSADTPGAGYSTIIIPLQYISAVNMAEILGPLAEESAFVRVDNSRNLLMLAGTREQLVGWLDIITTFDVNMLEGMSVGFFPLENVTVDEINDALTGLLGVGSGGENSSDFSHLVRLIPFERLNSVLVVTPRAHYLEQVRTWIERLDKAPESSLEKRLFVYPVQNTTAGRLAELLTNIYSGGRGGAGRGPTNRGAVGGAGGQSGGAGGTAPGLTPETVGSSSGRPSSQQAVAATVASIGSAFSQGNNEWDDVRVVSDDENNALMIYATRKNYKKIEAALDQLDVVATQVIIEASIMEVSLSDELKYGLEWAFKSDLGNNYDGLGRLANSADGPAAIASGFSYTITNFAGDISAVLNALAKDSLLNVISTPSVMVLDNHTATIHVGDQIPVFSSQTITNGGNTSQSVEYRDTGVKLSVQPSVNAGGLVTMTIEQSVTDIGEVDAATGQSTFLERNITSRVAVRSNESVVLGGLIRENASEGSAGVPWLHSLPVIGGLFGTIENKKRRTELLVIITPRALYNQSELRAVSEEMRAQIRHLELVDVPLDSKEEQ